jgi:hypothetical protein
MTPHPAQSKVLLVAEPRAGVTGTMSRPIRRYRIARLRMDGRRNSEASRSDQLKRAHE